MESLADEEKLIEKACLVGMKPGGLSDLPSDALRRDVDTSGS
jgi:hypothetical protein